MDKITEQEVVEILKTFQETNAIIENKSVDFDVAKFATGFYKGYGAYTPDMTNTSMKNINFNPLTATIDTINAALNNAKNNESNLIAYGQDMYLKNMLYKRNFDYINSLPAWNLEIEIKNEMTSKDYKSPAFKKDFAKVRDFLYKFNYRAEFDRCFFGMLNSESFYCIFRKDMCDSKYVFQEFPYSYTKTTGRSTWGLLYDIDMTYFLQPSIDINFYPDWIKKKYNDLFKNKTNSAYIPSNDLNERTGVFAMWTQTSQIDGAWCFKFKNDLVANIPYFSPMLSDLVMIPVFRNLQLSQSMSAAKKVISSQWPLLKEQKVGNTADMLAVSPETMGRMLGVASAGIQDAYKILSLPSEKMEKMEFENTDKSAYSDFLKITASLMGGGNVLFSTTKNTVAETNLSLNIDEMLATSIYPQFEDFLDFQINNLTKQYKFRFIFNGTKTYFNKEANNKQAFESAAVGVVSINKIANAMGKNLFELSDELDMTNALGLTEKLMPMLNMYTQGQNEKTGGRPQKSATELTESGSVTRNAGSNMDKGGKI